MPEGDPLPAGQCLVEGLGPGWTTIVRCMDWTARPCSTTAASLSWTHCCSRTLITWLRSGDSARKPRHTLSWRGILRDAQILVAVASTWGPSSLLALHRDLLLRLPSELAANHRVHGYRCCSAFRGERGGCELDHGRVGSVQPLADARSVVGRATRGRTPSPARAMEHDARQFGCAEGYVGGDRQGDVLSSTRIVRTAKLAEMAARAGASSHPGHQQPSPCDHMTFGRLRLLGYRRVTGRSCE